MATADDKPESPRGSSDPLDILWSLVVWALRLVFYIVSILVVIVFGVMGVGAVAATGLPMGSWVGVLGGILGLIGGISLGGAAVVVAVLGVWFGALALIFLLGYLFLLDQDALNEAAARPEGGESQAGTPVVFWPPPAYRAAVIVAATAVLWAIYGLPALLGAKTWTEFREAFLAAVVYPLGLVGMVTRHWLAILGDRLIRNPRLRRAFLGLGPVPTPNDPGSSDFPPQPGPG